jgi:hypothetical protein
MEVINKHVEENLYLLLNKIINEISKKYNIDNNELKNLIYNDKSCDNNQIKCIYKLTRGKNKGKTCNKKISNGNFCIKHSNNLLFNNINSIENVKQKKIDMQIEEWLNTAIQQQTTILKKYNEGYIEQLNDLYFNKEFVVIGKINKNREIYKLERNDINLCDKLGWKYDINNIEDESF